MAVMSPVSAARFTPRPRNPALVVRFRAQISPPNPRRTRRRSPSESSRPTSSPLERLARGRFRWAPVNPSPSVPLDENPTPILDSKPVSLTDEHRYGPPLLGT